jgi:hypothetical protein
MLARLERLGLRESVLVEQLGHKDRLVLEYREARAQLGQAVALLEPQEQLEHLP